MSWHNFVSIDQQANERIERALSVLQEHVLKALQTVELSISEINEVLRGISDEDIRKRETEFYLRFKRTQQLLPQIESIWAFDKNGRPLVSSTVLPVPRNLDNSDRGYFRAHAEVDAGIYIGEVVRARVGSLRFFVVSGRRGSERPGRFEGVIGVTVLPEHFVEFYRKLSRGRDSFGLARADGVGLARFPETNETLLLANHMVTAIQQAPNAGQYTSVSSNDGIERRIGYRKVSGFPLYVLSGVETAAIRGEFLNLLLWQLGLGLPVVLVMFGLSLYALRRAESFRSEVLRREAAETALKQAQRLEAIGQLTGGVAHDFNNLLMIVSGNINRLKRQVKTEDRTTRNIEAIEAAVARGTALTRQLLSFSRRQTHELKVIDLKGRLPGIREMLQSSLRGDIVVTTKTPDQVWPIKLDINEFELALLNLAVNARDAMPRGGALSIEVMNITLRTPNPSGLDGDFVAVSVTDTGEGIAAEVLGRVFEPFFTTKEVGKGTGLGLSQVYGFANQAGGAATIASEVGQGTVVTLFLPRSSEAIDNESISPAPVGTSAPGGHALLVEDNSEVAAVASNLLEELGYTTSVVADAGSARSMLQPGASKFDLVLTDLVMPGETNGLELACWIRSQDYLQQLPVLIATGYSDRAQEASDAGFVILRKPFEAAALRDAIRDSQERRHR